nr:hypothetical protein CFP56_17711 [Quercus suber]
MQIVGDYLILQRQVLNGPRESGKFHDEDSQAQQLFQINAQTITPEALESVKAALASSEIEHKAKTKKKVVPRKAAGQAWEDPTLADWPKSV